MRTCVQTHNHHPISIDQELHAMLIITSLHSTQPNQTSFAAKSRAISIRVSCSVIADVQHVDNSSAQTTFVRSTFGSTGECLCFHVLTTLTGRVGIGAISSRKLDPDSRAPLDPCSHLELVKSILICCHGNAFSSGF